MGSGIVCAIGAGTYTWVRRPEGRFGRFLVGVGFLYALTSLNASGRPVAYLLGMTAFDGIEQDVRQSDRAGGPVHREAEQRAPPGLPSRSCW
jgi:hypothetical protein